MAEDDHDRREHDRRQRVPAQHSAADVGHHRVPHPRPPGAPASTHPADEDDAERRRDQRRRDERHGRAHGRRQHEEDGDRQHDLHDLSGRRAPRRRPAGRGRRRRTSRPWLTPRWTSPATPPGSVRLRNRRPVVGGDGGGQGQADAEAAGDDRPPPRTADGGDEDDGRRGQKSAAVDRARRRRGTGRCRDARSRRRARPPRAAGRAHRRSAPHGSTSRSAWPTVTARQPAVRLSQTAASVEIGVSGQRGLLLARGVDPTGEPLDGEVASVGAEPPRARSDDDLALPAGGTPRRRLPTASGPSRRPRGVMRRWCASNAAATRASSGSAGSSWTRPVTESVSSTGHPAPAQAPTARPARPP